MAKVKDVMSREVVSIDASDSCLAAVGRMHRSHVRHLPVVDGEKRLIGMLRFIIRSDTGAPDCAEIIVLVP